MAEKHKLETRAELAVVPTQGSLNHHYQGILVMPCKSEQTLMSRFEIGQSSQRSEANDTSSAP